jgi:hypothetical protein
MDGWEAGACRARAGRRCESTWLKPVRWAALFGLVVLSGCSWAAGWFGSSEPPARPIVEPNACPTAAILRPLAQTAIFAPGQPPQAAGLAFSGLLSEVDSSCDRAGDAVRLKLDTVVVGERGPAAGPAGAVDLWYFVAVTGPDQTILSKRLFPVHIEIPPNAKRAGVSDHVEETIPLGGRRPGDLAVVLGFQQSGEAAEYYRHYPRR